MLPPSLLVCPPPPPTVTALGLCEPLEKAEGCWKSGCILGKCLVCPLKAKLGSHRSSPWKEGRSSFEPIWDSEWDPLLHEACFSVASFYSANNGSAVPGARCMGLCTVLSPAPQGGDPLLLVVGASQARRRPVHFSPPPVSAPAA